MVTDDILASEDATVDVLRCNNPDCGYELLADEEDEYRQAMEADEWFECPGCSQEYTIEPARVTLRERLDAFIEAVEDTIDAAEMIMERLPHARPRVEEMLEGANQALAQMQVSTRLRGVFTVAPDGAVTWSVERI